MVMVYVRFMVYDPDPRGDRFDRSCVVRPPAPGSGSPPKFKGMLSYM